jgi:calcineurin-like phosphoesterase family protein
MSKIYFTSDLHFGHDREFLYKPRGFSSIEEHDEAIIERWNNVVEADDMVFILGDLMLNDNEHGLECLSRLNGSIVIVRGNHDTPTRMDLYSKLPNVSKINEGSYLSYGKYHFYLTHFPCLSANLEAESLKQCTLNLSGHTHSKQKFFEDRPYVYNVACDAHNCTPVCIDEIIEDMKEKVKECLLQL